MKNGDGGWKTSRYVPGSSASPRCARPSVDEDDEREAEAALVLLVQVLQLGQDLGLGPALFLGRLADSGVRRERRDLIVLGERERHLLGDLERVLARGELVHESRSP